MGELLSQQLTAETCILSSPRRRYPLSVRVGTRSEETEIRVDAKFVCEKGGMEMEGEMEVEVEMETAGLTKEMI